MRLNVSEHQPTAASLQRRLFNKRAPFVFGRGTISTSEERERSSKLNEIFPWKDSELTATRLITLTRWMLLPRDSWCIKKKTAPWRKLDLNPNQWAHESVMCRDTDPNRPRGNIRTSQIKDKTQQSVWVLIRCSSSPEQFTVTQIILSCLIGKSNDLIFFRAAYLQFILPSSCCSCRCRM